MILIAGAMTAVLVMARRGGFSHWFSNPATHSTAVPGTKELYAPKQEYGNQGNLREPKSITLEPLSARLTGSVQEMALPASGKDTTSKSQDLFTQFEEELAKNPNNAKAHFLFGSALLNAGRESDAIFHFSETIRLDDSNYIAMNNLAWIRASHPDPKLRDGAEAIRLAKRACELTEYKIYICVDTLAIAYAEAQQFTEAISTAEKALELANSANQQAVADEIQGHLVLFRAGKPFREVARPAAPTLSDR